MWGRVERILNVEKSHWSLNQSIYRDSNRGVTGSDDIPMIRWPFQMTDYK